MGDEQTPTNQTQEQNVEQNAEQKPNKVAARINQLYGEKKEAEELATALQEENGVLRTQVDELSSRINALEAAAPKLTTEDPAVKDNSGLLSEDKILDVVHKAVGQVFQQREESNRRATELRQAHVKSWQTAMQQFPELKDQSSELYKTANNLWARDPDLAKSGNGPMKAVILARGMMDEPGQISPAAAAGAGGNVGNASATNLTKELEKVEEEIKEVKNKLNEGSYTASAWVKYQDLKQKRAELLKKKG